MARTLPTTGLSPLDCYMDGATTPGMYVNVTTDATTTNQSYIGGVMYAEDATTKASGTSYGFRFRMTASGTKTGGDVNALGTRLSVTGATPGSCNAFSIYTSVGAVATDSLRGIYMYMDTCTTVPSSIVYGIDIGIVGTGLSTVGHFIRMYNHGSAALNSVFCLDNASQAPATYLFKFGASELAPCSAGSDSANVTNKIAIDLGGATRYLHVFSD